MLSLEKMLGQSTPAPTLGFSSSRRACLQYKENTTFPLQTLLGCSYLITKRMHFLPREKENLIDFAPKCSQNLLPSFPSLFLPWLYVYSDAGIMIPDFMGHYKFNIECLLRMLHTWESFSSLHLLFSSPALLNGSEPFVIKF